MSEWLYYFGAWLPVLVAAIATVGFYALCSRLSGFRPRSGSGRSMVELQELQLEAL